MALTSEGTQLTERHRLLQQRLAALTAAEMRQLWRLLDPDRLDSTAPGWLAAARQLIGTRRVASAELASRYYTQFRLVEVGSVLEPPAIRPLNVDQVTTSLSVTGLVRADPAAATATATRHVLNGGRDVLLGAVRSDPVALGWVRVTAFNPCAFCALMASRGPVYKSATSAGFQAHDACACSAEPVYSSEAEWPGRANEWADLYTSEAQGTTDPLNAFRRAYEN